MHALPVLLFPYAESEGYSEQSPQNAEYNCIAWAAEDAENFWWPNSDNSYWPESAPEALNIAAFVEAYRTVGYDLCDNDQLESEFDKIAIYADGGMPTHAARQLTNGRWTSKLGRDEDIEHHTLHALEGPIYGFVAKIMKLPSR